MSKDETQSSQLNLTVVALVALVAIVGLVALVINVAGVKTSLAKGSQIASAADEQNVAGDALRRASTGGRGGTENYKAPLQKQTLDFGEFQTAGGNYVCGTTPSGVTFSCPSGMVCNTMWHTCEARQSAPSAPANSCSTCLAENRALGAATACATCKSGGQCGAYQC